jgi:hypothetical protein
VSGPAISSRLAAVCLVAVIWRLVKCCYIWPLLLSLPLLILLPRLLSELIASGWQCVAGLPWHRRLELHLCKSSALQAELQVWGR